MKLLKNNISPIQKICLSGLFIALVMILNKVVAINYIPVIPFVRISFGGTALVIFASYFLGPIYGLFIGVFSDLIGYFIFDPKTFGFFPQITLTYLLLGFVPFFLFSFVKLIKNKKLILFIEYFVFAVIFALITLFLFTQDSFKLYSQTYTLDTLQKVIILAIAFVFFALIIISNHLFNRKKQTDRLTVFHISFVVFITDFLIVTIFGSLMKAWAFGFNMFNVIFITQAMLMFLNVPLNTFIILLIMRISKNFYKGVGIDE